MDVYDAIKEMRRLSKVGETFSMTFMSCNLSAGKSDGIIHVRKARLLKRPSEKFHKDAEFVERYINLDTGESRYFYQPLLMEFNSNRLILQ